MIGSIMDVLHYVDALSDYLESCGMELDAEGFPVFRKEMFLDDWPESVVPYRWRRSMLVSNPETTVLNFYCGDELIYPRIEKLFSDLPEYSRYMGVIGLDLTVTEDMDIEWQGELMLLNQLFTAALAINGIKVVANLRCGSVESEKFLDSIPRGVMCASGFLGCRKIDHESDLSYLSKVLRVGPSKLVIYGKSDSVAEKQLSSLGVDWRRYEDTRRRYFSTRISAM